jgi:hypothetical protein
MKKIRIFAINITIFSIVLLFYFSGKGQAEDGSKWLTQIPLNDAKNTIIYQAMGDYDGKHYETTVYGRDFEGVPKWKEGAEPPISVLKAKIALLKPFPEA